MADVFWRGDAPAVQEVKTIVVGGTPANGQVYTVTINGKGIAYTANGSDTNSTIATALQALLAATDDTPPEFDELTYTVDTATITATVTESGVPVTLTSSATGTGTLVTTTTTTATGPNWWSNAANWSGGAVPVNGDNVYIRKNDVDILYGLNQSGVTLAILEIEGTYTGKIGLPDTNANGYFEYRETFLKIGATLAYVGRGFGTGPGRLRWNAGTVQTTATVASTGTPEDGIVAAFDFVGTHASNAINAQRGTLGFGVKPGVATTVATLKIGSKDNQASDVSIYSGSNVTLGTVSMNGGALEVCNGATTITVANGTLTATAGAFTTISNGSGTVNYDTTGTLGTYVGGTNSMLDCSRVVASRTITSATFHANSSFRDPAKTVTFGGSGATINCKLDELGEFDVGELFVFQRS